MERNLSMPALSRVQHVVFFSRDDLDPQVLRHLEDRLRAQGVTTERGQVSPRKPDLIVSLGGDGTLLRAGSWAAEHEVPVLGINHGTLGFLTAFRASELNEAVDAIFQGTLQWEERIRMHTTLHRDGAVVGSWCAINDTIVKHGTIQRLLTIQASIDDQPIATYKADGLIVATPTGSTAYNLAAGGPILYPTNRDFVITPICPHCVTHRIPVVVSATNGIQVAYQGPTDRDALLMVDAYPPTQLLPGDLVRITGNCKPLRICPSPHSVFRIMNEKLGWGGHDGS